MLPSLLQQFSESLAPLDAQGMPAFLAQTSPLNMYLLVFAEFGMIGIFAMLSILWIGVKRARYSAVFLFRSLRYLSGGVALDLVLMPAIWIMMSAIFLLDQKGEFFVPLHEKSVSIC